jgi:glycosyltransferase involved in cell wall biosynthesis
MKVSVIITNYNLASFLDITIQSVLQQEYKNLELIIIDGGSTDNSSEIIKKYAQQISYFISERDNGMYDALNKGLGVATGEIITYINSDDILYPHSIETAVDIFNSYPHIEWLTGIPNQIDEKGRIVWSSEPKIWTKFNYAAGEYQYIQQEGTFWRRTLMKKAGYYFNLKYKYAGDMELWSRFFCHTNLFVVYCFMGAFRLRSQNQKSLENIALYNNEAEQILIHFKLLDKMENRILKMYQKRLFKFLHFHRFYRLIRFFGFSKVLENVYRRDLSLYFNRVSQKFEPYYK